MQYDDTDTMPTLEIIPNAINKTMFIDFVESVTPEIESLVLELDFSQWFVDCADSTIDLLQGKANLSDRAVRKGLSGDNSEIAIVAIESLMTFFNL